MREYCVISHTHWDREWYLSFEQFRLRLVSLMDNVIELLEKEEKYIFHLDAQTIVLEDYLEIKPAKKERLQKLISEGRLLVGPWYVQNDFNLVSGEATVRNLLIGIKLAEDFGRCMTVGYAPDQFGLISQLPQILSKFGINSCIFGRGKENYGIDADGTPEKVNEKAEFYWYSEDGSHVLGIYLPFWYNNAQRFSESEDKALYFLKKIEGQLVETSSTPYFLLMNGVDHLEAQENLLPILDKLNRLLPQGEVIKQTTLTDYIDKVNVFLGKEKLSQYSGEMRNGNDRNLLQGTLSTRVGLKQMNAHCQMLLENCLEPLYSWLHMKGIGEYPHGVINYIWKLLVKNHPHDSICGCHMDAVTAHMEDRFLRVREICVDMIGNAMEMFSNHISTKEFSGEDYLLTFFNTLINDRSEIADVEIEFDKNQNIKDFEILDSGGVPAPYRILGQKGKKVRRFSPINLPSVVDVDSFLVRMHVEDVPAQGYRTYTIRPRTEGASVDTFKPADESSGIMENSFLKAQINNDGTIDILHKQSGALYKRFLLIEDREDIGDSYNYMKSETGRVILSDCCKPLIYLLEDDGFTISYCIEYNMQLPSEYDYTGKCRSSNEACNKVKINLCLDKFSSFLKVTMNIDNQAKDHRMRVLFPTGITTEFSFAGMPFDIVKRDKTKYNPGINNSADQPFNGFVAAHEGGRGVAFFSKGLYEYENMRDEGNTIAITLLRGNSSLYKPGCYDEPEELFVIPGNQCTGIHTFELAIYPFNGDTYSAEVIKKSQEFSIPMQYYFRPVDRKKESKGSSFVQDAAISEVFTREDPFKDMVLAPGGQFVKLTGRDIEFSVLKVNENRKSVILRFYNSSSAYRETDIELNFNIDNAYLTDLKEERMYSLKADNGKITGVGFNPKEIVTIEVLPV